MKLKSSEKILLIVLALVIVLVAYYYLLLNPQLAKLSKAKDTATQYKAKVEEMKAQMDPNHPIYEEFKSKQEEIINQTDRLYPWILQDRIITNLNGKFKSVGVNPDSIAFSIVEKSVASEQNTAEKPAVDLNMLREGYLSIDNPELKSTAIRTTDPLRMHELMVSFTIKSDYQKLFKLIETLEKDKYKIFIDNLNISLGEGSELNNNIAISFVSVPKLNEESDTEYYKWPFKFNSNKNNPFVLNANLNAVETVTTAKPAAKNEKK